MTGRPAIEQLRHLCDAINWGDRLAAHAQCATIFGIAGKPASLIALLEHFEGDERLLQKSRVFNLFKKLVLLDDPAGRWKLRLHLFENRVLEAHHHQASFCAHVLKGQYKHLLFGETGLTDESRFGSPLSPLFVQLQSPDTSYFIDHRMVHATLAEELTVTLMLQGPGESDSFEIYDLETGRKRTRTSIISPTAVQEPGEQVMTRDDVGSVAEALQLLDLLPAVGCRYAM